MRAACVRSEQRLAGIQAPHLQRAHEDARQGGDALAITGHRRLAKADRKLFTERWVDKDLGACMRGRSRDEPTGRQPYQLQPGGLAVHLRARGAFVWQVCVRSPWGLSWQMINLWRTKHSCGSLDAFPAPHFIQAQSLL